MLNDRYYRLCLDYVPLVFLLLAAFPSYAYQNLAIATGEPDFFRNPVTNFNSARFSANDPIYDPGSRTVTTTRPYNVTGLDGKTYQATITKTAAADIPKVGAALSKFAQRVGPLSMALATADLICSLANICNVGGVFNQMTPVDTNTALGDSIGWSVNGNVYSSQTLKQAISSEFAGCGYGSAGSGCYATDFSWSPTVNGGVMSFKLKSATTGNYLSGVIGANKINPYVPPAPTGTPATSSDWTNKETALSTPAGADRLAAELEPLPIQVPSVFAPISVPLGTSTATNKDALGNATGTQQTTRRMDIEDSATEAEPYRVTVKETETVTKYDLNNQPISSTETSSESQTQSQTEPQKIDFPDYQAEFDTVSDTELPTSEFSADFNPVSWGSSASCPPDLTTTVRGVNLAIRTAPICDAAETFRPLILVLASLSAAGIALGVRTRGSD